MAKAILEGLTVEEEEFNERSEETVRVAPWTMPKELRDEIERLANDEMRSMSNMCRVLVERGLKYTDQMKARARTPSG